MLLDIINNPNLDGMSKLLFLVIAGLAFAAALTIHEFAHAFASDRLGDPTPRLLGRLTLNPLAHLDPIGTLMILFASFGWAKPVPFDPFNLRNPRRDSALISLAGPLANLTLAILSSLLLRLVPTFSFGILSPIGLLLSTIIVLNVNLAIFNLIPIYPFDGFHVVQGFLSERAARQWAQLESLGYIMILVLVFPLFGSSPILSFIRPIISFLTSLLIPSMSTI